MVERAVGRVTRTRGNGNSWDWSEIGLRCRKEQIDIYNDINVIESHESELIWMIVNSTKV